PPPAGRAVVATGAPATDAALGVVSIRAKVVGGRSPVRLSLLINGDVVDTWTDCEALYDLSLDDYGPGRHAVTARAVDALGRWSGASIVVACSGVHAADQTAERD